MLILYTYSISRFMWLLIKIITSYINFYIIFSKLELIVLILLTVLKITFSNREQVINEHSPTNLEIDSPESEYEDLQNFTIQAKEQWHIVKDNLGKWHIALVIEVFDWDESIILCIDVLVSASLFFRFPLTQAKQYLIEIADDDSVVLAADLQYNIVGVGFQIGDLCDLPDSTLILNTFWIRIIQRAWKRVYVERMRRLKLRGSLKAQRQFELSGKYGITTCSGLRGLLYNQVYPDLIQSQQI